MNKDIINILLTEDEPDDIELTRKSLQKLDCPYRLDHARTGKECLKKLHKKKYQLLLLDYKIPDKDGLAVIKEIRSRGFDLPIVMVTGKGSENVAAESIKMGAQDYIIKKGDYFNALPQTILNNIEKYKLVKEKQALEKEVKFEREKLQLIFDNMGDGVCMVDVNRNILLFNKQFGKMFGKIPSHAKCYEVIKDIAKHCPDCYMGAEIPADESRHLEIVTRFQRTLMATFTPFHSLQGDKVFLEVYKDITEKKESEKKLYIASITDFLTGLYNQGHFYKVLQREMVRSKRNNRPLSLILFDVDKFKEYNDEKGHQEGDKVLQATGRVVKKEIRKEIDLAFRYGGDEFTIILPETSLGQAKKLAERIGKSFAACNFTTLSMGVIELQKAMNIEMFIKEADHAMYKAKKSGGNCIAR